MRHLAKQQLVIQRKCDTEHSSMTNGVFAMWPFCWVSLTVILTVVMLSVVVLSVLILSVIMLNVVMLNGVTPIAWVLKTFYLTIFEI